MIVKCFIYDIIHCFYHTQMEYCEKNTLRQLIDTGELHKNNEEVWRLFRELVEGLAHIHSRVRVVTIVTSCYWSCVGCDTQRSQAW